ncbi:MAG: hydantoinase/oxoprolinase family protein [Streptosporangiales bacterium]|nr:hydantoinase/oxoprolinase family protein [Streptosporangiales bacterium]
MFAARAGAAVRATEPGPTPPRKGRPMPLTEDPEDAAFSSCYLGVDVGGTFTDLLFYDDDGEMHCVKVPSTKQQPANSTLNGIAELKARPGAAIAGWSTMHHTHSSTVATNAVIERTGAVVGMLVTKGMRDVLTLGRFALPHPMRFDSRRVAPLIRRGATREVRERMTVTGDVLQPLHEDDVVDAAAELAAQGVQTIVVCFLHSYRNPAHEERAAALVTERFPELSVQTSSAVWPQAREYERATLASMNAFVQPTVAKYAGDLIDGVRELGITTAPRIARSNGGVELLSTLRHRPVAALLSGPAAGVTGAALAAAETGWADADLLTVDMGGTSADIGVIRAGQPVLSSEEHIAEFPLLLPSIAVSAIGAGGGSIIWRQNDTLKVGPRSVGADPGPACYGNPDATHAALTDAFLVAGLLGAGQQLAGRLPLQAEPAASALAQLGAGTAAETADSAIRIAISMMAAESMNVLSKRGIDADEFRLVAYGGAGPLVAALLADEIRIRSVLIPHTPGALSAFGAAQSNLEGDLLEPVYQTTDELSRDALATHVAALKQQIDAWIATQNSELKLPEIVVQFSAEMRYDGQGYDVSVPVFAEWLEEADIPAILDAFHTAHETAYGHSSKDAAAWLNELRAHVIGVIPKVESKPSAVEGTSQPQGHRDVRLGGREFSAAVYQRPDLAADTTTDGPAIIDQMDTTTFVPGGWTAHVHSSLNITLNRQK